MTLRPPAFLARLRPTRLPLPPALTRFGARIAARIPREARIAAAPAAVGALAAGAVVWSLFSAAEAPAGGALYGLGLAALALTALTVHATRTALRAERVERAGHALLQVRADVVAAAEAWAESEGRAFDRRAKQTGERKLCAQLHGLASRHGTLYNALDASRVGQVLFDVKGHILYENPKFREIETACAEALRAELEGVETSEQGTQLFDYLREKVLLNAAAMGGGRPGEPRVVRLAWGATQIEVRLMMALDSEGEKAGYFAEFSDVTEETVLEERISRLIENFKAGELYSRVKLDMDERNVRNKFLFNVARDLNSLLDVIAEFFADVDSAVMAMVSGDVTFKMSGEYQGEFENLKNSMNDSMQTFEKTLIQTNRVASSVQSATESIAGMSRRLSEQAEHQNSAIVESRETLGALSGSIRENAAAAERAAALSGETSQRAEKGRELLDETSQAMQAIQSSTGEIGEISRLIKDIAFQTNLLALNAAVEAARAGDAGRGFAIVAQEVRNLANRSSEAASTIQKLITESKGRVESGAKLFKQTADALKSIVEAVAETTQVVSSISQATRHEASGAEDMVVSVDRIAEAASQNTEIAEANSGTAADLKRHVEALRETVSFFIVSEAPDAGPMESSDAA
jgi:methyl-accepting chemotaxis protein